MIVTVYDTLKQNKKKLLILLFFLWNRSSMHAIPVFNQYIGYFDDI